MVDIRFVRLAVSIRDIDILNWYFFQALERIENATLYCELYDLWRRIKGLTVQGIADFLEKIYEKDPNKLIFLLTYIIFKDLPKYMHIFYQRRRPAQRPYSNNEMYNLMLKDLSGFLYELESLGIVWDRSGFIYAIGTPELDSKINSRLESMLSELGDVYLARYRGAKEALTSDNPDKFSQSIGSMRELLNDILRLLTKDEVFSDDEKKDGKPTRRARIKHILAKSKGLSIETLFVDAIANTLIKTNKILSKEFHLTSEKDRETILFVYKSTEYLIYYILTQNKSNS